MGVNNRKRRAAKQRKRAKAGRNPQAGSGGPRSPYRQVFDGGLDEHSIATWLVGTALDAVRTDPRDAGKHARLLLDRDSQVTPKVIARVVGGWLADDITAVVRGGWMPADLGEIVRRRLTAEHEPIVAALLTAEADRHRADLVSSAWREELARLEAPAAADLRKPRGLELALGLAAVLSTLPAITELLPPPGSTQNATRSRASGNDTRQLSRVRTLLAKAESTEYPEEAEALSAKAQELISRHALDRLIEQSDERTSDNTVVARRFWIDAPYVMAKAVLVDAVADANRCRSVVSEQLGFSTIIGDAADLDSVEVMCTSLLVQANRAMLTYGRQTDQRGTSRTRSFRSSFLTSYASRIAELLSTATAHATEESGRAGALVPVLRQQAELVDEACEQLFPQVISREATISNRYGWAAGRAAADLALLDPHLHVTSAAS